MWGTRRRKGRGIQLGGYRCSVIGRRKRRTNPGLTEILHWPVVDDGVAPGAIAKLDPGRSAILGVGWRDRISGWPGDYLESDRNTYQEIEFRHPQSHWRQRRVARWQLLREVEQQIKYMPKRKGMTADTLVEV